MIFFLTDFLALFLMFLIPLVLTLVLELFMAYLFGYRKKKEILAITFINLITNPLMNFIILVLAIYFELFYNFSIFYPLVLEFLVIIVEWLLLKYTIDQKSSSLLKLSIVMNLFSLIFGLIIFIGIATLQLH
jgi:hypothetical protein